LFFFGEKDCRKREGGGKLSKTSKTEKTGGGGKHKAGVTVHTRAYVKEYS